MIQAVIIPIRRMPEKIQGLDYLIPDELADKIKIGQLVTMPLRKKIEYGIVYSLASTLKIDLNKLKPITSIVAPEPMIPEKLLLFYTELAEFYRAPLGFVLKTALPPLLKTKLPKLNLSLRFNTDIKLAKPELKIYQNNADKKIFLQNILNQAGQALILVPEAHMLGEYAALDIQREIIIFDDAGDKKYFDVWKKISETDDAVIVATRRTLFLPWRNLRHIVIDDEGAFEYKSWDMAPRYQTREAALSLAKFTGAKTYLLSPTPSVESYYFAAHDVYDHNGEPQKYAKPSPIFTDPIFERRGGGNGVISEEIINEIKNSNGRAFIFLNRRGTSGGVICRDCGNIFRCDKCDRPLSFFAKSYELKCLYCKTKIPLHETCDKCGGANFNLLGRGVEGAAEILRQSLPERDIVVIDKESDGAEMTDKSVIIGTEFAWARVDLSQMSIIVFADPDAALVNSEFKSVENLWQKLRRSQSLANPEAKLFIQTKNPEHYVFRALYDPKIFYEDELTQRKMFEFPPYKYLTRLIISSSSEAALRAKSEDLYRNLNALTLGRKDVKIYSPMSANPPINKGEYKAIILVKADYANYKKTMKELLTSLPEDVKVDPNPNNILSIN